MKRCFYSVVCFAFVACQLLVPVAPAMAARSMGNAPRPFDAATLHHVKIGAPSSTHIACQLGETRPPAWINAGYLAPPDDNYYTLLRVSDCPGCGAGGLLVTNAHAVLWFDVPCTIPVEVSIVPAIGSAACPVPDVNNPICGPAPYQLQVSNAGGYDFIMALPFPCCITQDAFLRIRFLDGGDCTTLPSLVAADLPCNGCFSYNLNPAFGFVDMCSDPYWTQYQSGNPNMYVDTDCCTITPTHPGTWGRVKQLYR